LLEYSLGEARSFLFAATSSGVEGHELPGREVIETAARQVYEGLRVNDPRAATSDRRAAARLSDLLLAPVADRLAGQRLAIVADGALHYLPFAALPDPAAPGDPLLARHEVVVLPSASALAVQRKALAGRPPATKVLAVLADPVFGPPDPRLSGARAASGPVAAPSTLAAREPVFRGAPSEGLLLDRLGWSRWEAEAIAGHAAAGEVRVELGFDADLDAVRAGGLRDHRIVHFATHGIVDSEHPELSALVLSLYDARGNPRDGLLRLPEIYRLDLDADLVVLSGCRTALGREVRGEGLVGLTRGFFAAGARSLVATLWPVQDRAAADLMDRFYRHLLDPDHPLPPAAALRAAQLELMRRPAQGDPYFWAAFAAYGDWR
jgi:CHAT domain-containing protein